jgi:hypothetical protein
MKVVKAALEAYAKRYASLGIQPNELEARALVISVVHQEDPDPKPSDTHVQEMATDFIRRVSDLTEQPASDSAERRR